MADITKPVNRIIPVTQRSQNFTHADASAGDVILVPASMGKPASRVLIETSANMQVRFNVYHKVYPQTDRRDQIGMDSCPHLASGIQIQGASGAIVSLATDETFETNTFPVEDIEIVMASGVFDIFTT